MCLITVYYVKFYKFVDLKQSSVKLSDFSSVILQILSSISKFCAVSFSKLSNLVNARSVWVWDINNFSLFLGCVRRTFCCVFIYQMKLFQDSFKQITLVDLSSDVIITNFTMWSPLGEQIKNWNMSFLKKIVYLEKLEHRSRRPLSTWILDENTDHGVKQWSPRAFIFLSWTPGALQVLTRNLTRNPGALNPLGAWGRFWNPPVRTNKISTIKIKKKNPAKLLIDKICLLIFSSRYAY